MNYAWQTRIALQVWYRYVWQTNWRLLWLVLIPVFVSVLQWLLNIELLVDIFSSNSGLSFLEKIDVIADGVGKVFTQLNDWTPVTFILISVLQAAALVLFIILKRQAIQGRQASLKHATSMSVAIFGAGCVACGGSLVAPILSIIGSNVSIGLAQSIGDVLLLLAVILSWYALTNISKAPYFRVTNANKQ
jgi:hypothetical protein